MENCGKIWEKRNSRSFTNAIANHIQKTYFKKLCSPKHTTRWSSTKKRKFGVFTPHSGFRFCHRQLKIWNFIKFFCRFQTYSSDFWSGVIRCDRRINFLLLCKWRCYCKWLIYNAIIRYLHTSCLEIMYESKNSLACKLFRK